MTAHADDNKPDVAQEKERPSTGDGAGEDEGSSAKKGDDRHLIENQKIWRNILSVRTCWRYILNPETLFAGGALLPDAPLLASVSSFVTAPDRAARLEEGD